MNNDLKEIQELVANRGTGLNIKDIIKFVYNALKAKHGYDAKVVSNPKRALSYV